MFFIVVGFNLDQHQERSTDISDQNTVEESDIDMETAAQLALALAKNQTQSEVPIEKQKEFAKKDDDNIIGKKEEIAELFSVPSTYMQFY